MSQTKDLVFFFLYVAETSGEDDHGHRPRKAFFLVQATMSLIRSRLDAGSETILYF